MFKTWIFFLLLLLVPLLHRYWMRKNKTASVKFSIPIPKHLKKTNPMKWLFIVKYIGLVFLVVALARPQEAYKQTERNVSGVDIMLVMDVSASMNIEDLAERPRLEVAKETMEKFIEGRENDRIGFLVFSGEAFTLAPPTLDYGLVLSSIRDAKIGELKDGTAIGDGLALAVSRLRNSKAKSRIVILLTDGENNLGQVDPGTAGEMAEGYGIRVYTIAIGREGRVRLPIRHKTAFGNTITTYQWFENQLNPELLQKISQLTKGKFFRVTEASTLSSVFSEINQLEKSEVKAKEKTRYTELFQKPLTWGLVALIFEKFLSQFWWRFVI